MSCCQLKKWSFESRERAIKMGLNTLATRLSTLANWPEWFESLLALTSVNYHRNVLVSILLNQWLALAMLRATGPWTLAKRPTFVRALIWKLRNCFQHSPLVYEFVSTRSGKITPSIWLLKSLAVAVSLTRFHFSVMFISERFMPLAYDSNFGEKSGDHLSSHPLHELCQSTLTVIGASWI